MKILITGGAGYIGSSLVEFFLKENHKVTVIDNFMFGTNSLNSYMSSKNFNVVKLDVRDSSLKNYINSHDVIIPLAALVGAPLCNLKKKEAIEVNTNSIKNLIEIVSKDQIIIFPTTNSGYGIGEQDKFCTEETPLNPISLYGKTKTEAENIVSQHENSVRFRLATVFGSSPRMRLDLLVNDFVHKAVKDGYIVLFEAKFKRNYIHVKDVCRSIIYSINNFDSFKSEVFNVGLSSANLSKLELCEKIKKYIPKLEIVCSEINEDIDKRDYIVSNEKIEKKGFKTKYDLDFGITELIKLYSILVPDSTTKNI